MKRNALISIMVGIFLSMPAPARAQAAQDQMLAFAAGNTIFTVEAASENLRKLGAGSNPVWSPDGSHLAFYRDRALWVMGHDGSRQRMLAAGSVFESSYQWSPDGTYLAYQAVDPTNAAIPYPLGLFIVEVTGEARPRPISEQYVPWYAWSRDSAHLAYTGLESRLRSYPAAINVVAVESGNQMNVTSGIDSSARVDWSPDGTRLAMLTINDDSTALTLSVQALDRGMTGTFDISAILEGESLVTPPQVNWQRNDLLIMHTYTYDQSASMEGARQSIWFVNPSDGSTRRIVTETHHTYVSFPYDSLTLSPDGASLYYLEVECAEGYHSPNSYAQIIQVNLADLSRQRIGNIGKDAACGAVAGPSWRLSPNGAQIAFGVTRLFEDTESITGLFIMDRDGGNLRPLFETDLLASFGWRPS